MFIQKLGVELSPLATCQPYSGTIDQYNNIYESFIAHYPSESNILIRHSQLVVKCSQGKAPKGNFWLQESNTITMFIHFNLSFFYYVFITILSSVTSSFTSDLHVDIPSAMDNIYVPVLIWEVI